MNFTKMSGLGNDFVLIEEVQLDSAHDLSFLAKKICDRHFGVGADGLVIIAASDHADLKMRIFNPDGSEAEMCGNAIRCFAKYVFEREIFKKDTIKVETLAGIMVPELVMDKGNITAVKVDMGEPKLKPEEIPAEFEGESIIGESVNAVGMELEVTCVSMGNPHAVIFVPDVNSTPVKEWGPQVCEHPVFPRQTNVEFIQIVDSGRIKMRVWERGAGETLACGTGACASVVAGVLNDVCARNVEVSLLGGKLDIEWKEKDNRVYMSGPAEEIFVGKIVNL